METFGIILTVLLIIFLVLVVLSGLLLWLWNMTIPEVFGLKEITFWQAFRILLIASLLFGGAQNDEFRKIREGIDDINIKLEVLINEE
tara:strand:- start:671 stop:934 length:264 start_codon:yes stop_codon:yes gene_type:complete